MKLKRRLQPPPIEFGDKYVAPKFAWHVPDTPWGILTGTRESREAANAEAALIMNVIRARMWTSSGGES